MRLPMTSKQQAIQGVSYGTKVTVKLVLRKRDVLKIVVPIVVTELLLTGSTRRAVFEKTNVVVDKASDWLDGEPGSRR